MPGFWTQTEAGRSVHIYGDPGMSAETKQALCVLMQFREYREEQQKGDQ